MSEGKGDQPFFIGFAPVPAPLRGFLIGAALLLVAGLGALGFAMGAAQDDPGQGALRFDYGRQTLQGVIEPGAYPIFHVTQGTERVPAGESFVMTAGGKSGVAPRANPLAGGLAQASGVLLERGALYMLQVRGGRNGLRSLDGDVPEVPAPEPLGTWRLTGEICDGKCLAGAMRPGRGLAHKACANLCLLGDVPPVFVSTHPVAGEQFMLVTGPNGGRLPAAAYDAVGEYVSVTGTLAMHGTTAVFAIDPATIARVP
ncbi:MAG: hypothetical protein AAGM84_07710 [Pseudomonadota bacterium]